MLGTKKKDRAFYVRFSEEELRKITEDMRRHGITTFCDFIRMKVGMPTRDVIDRVDMLERAIMQLQRERFGLEKTEAPVSIDEVVPLRKVS